MKQQISDTNQLFDTVVHGGYCIGCGVCAVVDNSIEIKYDRFQKLQAVYNSNIKHVEKNETSVLSVCPFSNSSQNEDSIGKRLFGKYGTRNEKLGYVLETYVGHVNEESYRGIGSSGGMGTWILDELLKLGEIDGVVHVKENKSVVNGGKMFEYQISYSSQEIKEGAKTRYYPIELSEVFQKLKEKPGNYALVGIPCFIKAARLLMGEEEIFGARIKYCIGLVCGHLKSANFSKMLSWQTGVHPDNLSRIDFRTKLESEEANNYGITVQGKVQNKLKIITSLPIRQLYGIDWGLGLFKYKACDYCDDVVAETADLSIGDAWLPNYVKDAKGTNIVIVRKKELNDIIRKACNSNRLVLEKIDQGLIVKSQMAGFRHRRESLAFRLKCADEQGKWRPQKRVLASEYQLTKKAQKIQLLRMQISELSHEAFTLALGKNSFEVFQGKMSTLFAEYAKIYKIGLLKKITGRIKKLMSI